MEGKNKLEELKNIFEHEIKRKLSERARTSADEYRNLMSGFKFYDYAYTGRVNETEFVKSILRTGLSGFNDSDIRSLFKYYDKNNSGQIDYKNYCGYILGREELQPLPGQQNEKINDEQNPNIPNNTNINDPQLNQKQKTPIQKIKTPLNQPINNNNNQINNEQINNQNPIEATQSQPPIPKEEKENDEASQQAKEYFQKLVNSLKDQININNGITYYTFLYEVKNGCDENNTINIDTLFNALLDFSGSGKIALDDIINTIIDPILDHRKYYIVNKFSRLDTEKKGEVLISLLKEKYNPRGHPDVIAGKLSEEEAFKQFCYTLDIYCAVRNIKDVINYKQFLEYYNGISSSILDENYFIDILNGVWGDDNEINNIEKNNPNQNNNNNKTLSVENMNNPQPVNNENKRYNKTKFQENIPLKYNDSYADSNIGINSLLLGESSHVLPKSFGKRNFKKSNYSNRDLNNIKINSNPNPNPIQNQNIENKNEIIVAIIII